MPYRIVEREGRYCIYSDDGELVDCHDTQADAEAQLAALYANVEDAELQYDDEDGEDDEDMIDGEDEVETAPDGDMSDGDTPEHEMPDEDMPDDEMVDEEEDVVDEGIDELLEETFGGVVEAEPEGAPESSIDDLAAAVTQAIVNSFPGAGDEDVADELLTIITAALNEALNGDAEDKGDGEDDDEEDEPEPGLEKALRRVRHGRVVKPMPTLTNLLTDALGATTNKLRPGVTVLKGKGRRRYMFIVTSSSYKDRDGETITGRALKAEVDRHWHDGGYFGGEPVLFWHDERLPIGRIVWGDVRGPFLVEVAKELDTPVASAIWDYIDEHPGGWGASHKFEFVLKDRLRNGIFKSIRKLETSVLPRSLAANPFTYSGVVGEKSMDKERDKLLDAIFAEYGVEGASKLLDKGVDHLTRKLAEAGYRHKSVGTLPQPVIDMVDAQAAMEVELSNLRARAKRQNAQMRKLVRVVKALRAQMNNRPRSAIRAAATEIDETELTEAAKSGRFRYDPFWRTNVKTGV